MSDLDKNLLYVIVAIPCSFIALLFMKLYSGRYSPRDLYKVIATVSISSVTIILAFVMLYCFN